VHKWELPFQFSVSRAAIGQTQMHAVVIRLFVLVGALAALHSNAEAAFADEPSLDCGSLSDIHDGWVISSPEQQGFDPALLCAMGKGVMDGKLANVDSIIVVRHGVLVYERYFDYPNQKHFDATVMHAGNSMTKSVISLLVGIELDRGLIKDLDAPVLSYFPEYSDLRSPEKDRITLRHLLTMSAGLEWYESDVRFDASNSGSLCAGAEGDRDAGANLELQFGRQRSDRRGA
jgi:CubicO group peptidase (beta-lactamase class C family)